jgi:hypothetical protein
MRFQAAFGRPFIFDGQQRGLLPTVSVFPMLDAGDHHNALRVVDLVDDAVVPSTDPEESSLVG